MSEQAEVVARREARRLMILNWIPSEIARQPEKLKAFEAQLAADISGHKISFSRYGDFIAVKQERGGQKILRAVQLIREWAKNEKGERSRLQPASISFHPGAAGHLQGKGWAQEVHHNSTDFVVRPGTIDNYWQEPKTPQVEVSTGLAVPAEDDRISFDGAGVWLAVPFGMGEKAFQQLLQALGEPV